MADPRRAPSTDILAASEPLDRIYAVSGRADAVYESLKRMRRAEDAVSDRMRHAKRSMDKSDTTYKAVKALTGRLKPSGPSWMSAISRLRTSMAMMPRSDFGPPLARHELRRWWARRRVQCGQCPQGPRPGRRRRRGPPRRIREVFAAWRAGVEAVGRSSANSRNKKGAAPRPSGRAALVIRIRRQTRRAPSASPPHWWCHPR